MFDKYSKGETAQLMVQLRAAQKGLTVSKPTVECRYDLVVDHGSVLERGQIKYADFWMKTGSLFLDLRKETRNSGKKKLYQAHEVDALYVYVPRYSMVLRLDGTIFHEKKSLSFREKHLNNGLMRGCLVLQDYVW